MGNLPQDPDPTTPHVEIVNRFAQIPEALLYDPEISCHAKAVYAVLHRHGCDPSNCFPSHRRIARFLGAGEASIPKWVRELETRGWLQRVPRYDSNDGSQTSNGYRLFDTPPAAQQAPPRHTAGDPPAVQKGAPPPHSTPKESNGNESNTNDGALFKIEPQTPPRQVKPPDRFDEFWEVFPRKTGKGAAKRAWAKAITKADPSEIIDGAWLYANDRTRNPEFTKYPQGWLNDERWRDLPPERPVHRAADGRARVFLPGSGWVENVQ